MGQHDTSDFQWTSLTKIDVNTNLPVWHREKSSVSASDWTGVSPWLTGTPGAGGEPGGWEPWGCRAEGWGSAPCPEPPAGSGKFQAASGRPRSQQEEQCWQRLRGSPGPSEHRRPPPAPPAPPGSSHTDWPAGRRARPTCGVPGWGAEPGTPRDAPGPPGYSPGHLQAGLGRGETSHWSRFIQILCSD